MYIRKIYFLHSKESADEEAIRPENELGVCIRPSVLAAAAAAAV